MKAKGKGEINVAGIDIVGASIGGLETTIILPRWKLVFDIGRCTRQVYLQNYAFISHGHLDHISGLPSFIATRSLMGMAKPKIWVPISLVEPARAFVRTAALCGGEDMPCNINSMQVGDEVFLSTETVVRSFPTLHRVPSQGYLLSTIKNKLKPELATTTMPDIRKLRLRGQEVTNKVETPMVAFTGDTTIDFIHEPAAMEALRAELLIMECSFIDDTVSVADARGRGHIHLYEIAAAAAAFQHVKSLLLIHFSCRYSNEDIEAALDKHLPSDLRAKCTPMLAGRERHR